MQGYNYMQAWKMREKETYIWNTASFLKYRMYYYFTALFLSVTRVKRRGGRYTVH